MNTLLDFLFPPSFARITRSFERTRTRLTAFAARQSKKSSDLHEQAASLRFAADQIWAESQRAAIIAARFNDLLN